jgi:hypothetical protein
MESILLPVKGFVVVGLEYLDFVVFVSWGSIKSVRETTDLVMASRARAIPYLLHLNHKLCLRRQSLSSGFSARLFCLS